MRHINEIDHDLREVKQAQQDRRDRGFDLMLKRESLLDLTNEEIMTTLRDMYPERRLYSLSTDWRKDECYIMKARGTGGDVVVDWEKEKEV